MFNLNQYMKQQFKNKLLALDYENESLHSANKSMNEIIQINNNYAVI